MGTVSVDGLSSGLDTTSIISSIVAVAGANLRVMQNQKSDLELKRSHWQTFKTHLSSLETQIKTIDTESEFKSMTVSSADETAVTATVTGTALPGNYDVEVSQLAGAQITKSTSTWADGATAFTTGTSELYLSINGATASTVSIATNTLDGAISAINDATLGVFAYKVLNASSQYVLVLSSEDTGAAYNFAITQPADTSVAFEAVNTADAQDTLATVSGISVSSSTLDLSGAVPGVTLTAAGVTTAPVTVTVSTDVSGIKANINSFVDSYNTVLSYVSYEVKVNDSSQEAGPLAGDNTLRSIQRSIQGLINTSYNTSNSISSLSLMGIFTEDTGTLSVDDDALSAALNDYFSETIDFFTGSAGLFQAFTNVAADGQLDIILDSTDGTIQRKFDTLDGQITDMDDSIADEMDRLAKLEEMLRAKFTALEVALVTLKSTQQFVESALGSSSSSK